MALDIRKDIRDRSLESEGVWMEWDEDSAFLVARKTNPRYKAAFSRGYRENEKLLNSKTNTKHADEVADELMLECMANYLVLDWRGVVADGEPIAYDVELCKQILEERDDLRQLVDEFSESRANYIAERDNKDAEELEK